jgi:tRNA (adenine22-N1)-methyltransferase
MDQLRRSSTGRSLYKKLPDMDERMRMLIELTPQCGTIADIGADHAYASAHLLSLNRCDTAVVTDISEHAVARAFDNLSRYGLAERARFCRADGLEGLVEPADVILIAGMGARTVVQILESGRSKLGGATLILAPNRDPELVRASLPGLGYRIDRERVARAAGRFYLAMRAVPATGAEFPLQEEERAAEKLTAKTIYLGDAHAQDCDTLWASYWAWRMGVLKAMARGCGYGAQPHPFRDGVDRIPTPKGADPVSYAQMYEWVNDRRLECNEGCDKT